MVECFFVADLQVSYGTVVGKVKVAMNVTYESKNASDDNIIK